MLEKLLGVSRCIGLYFPKLAKRYLKLRHAHVCRLLLDILLKIYVWSCGKKKNRSSQAKKTSCLKSFVLFVVVFIFANPLPLFMNVWHLLLIPGEWRIKKNISNKVLQPLSKAHSCFANACKCLRKNKFAKKVWTCIPLRQEKMFANFFATF